MGRGLSQLRRGGSKRGLGGGGGGVYRSVVADFHHFDEKQDPYPPALLIPDPDPQQYLSGCAVPCLSFQIEIRHTD